MYYIETKTEGYLKLYRFTDNRMVLLETASTINGQYKIVLNKLLKKYSIENYESCLCVQSKMGLLKALNVELKNFKFTPPKQ